jgi:DNA-binding LacI/PurR family transcriptional regulator
MTAKGWEVQFQVFDFIHVKRPKRSWDEKVVIEEGQPVIALHGSFPLAQWALRKKVKILFLGGVIHDLPIPLVAVSTSMMVKMAMQKLVALGHTRIVLPICDHAPEFVHRLNSAMQQSLEANGHPYIKSYHTPESPYQTPDVTWRILERAFAEHPPTALVLLDWRELITAHCFLTNNGCRIPDDVSVVLLHDFVDVAWFQPKLARFRYPERRMIRAMIHWLEKGGSGESIKIPPPEFLLGKTIAPPRIDG